MRIKRGRGYVPVSPNSFKEDEAPNGRLLSTLTAPVERLPTMLKQRV